MAVVTWNVVRADIRGTMKYVTYQEVIDGVPGRTYSIDMHKNAPNAEMRDKMITKVNFDRSEATVDERIAFKVVAEDQALTFESLLSG